MEATKKKKKDPSYIVDLTLSNLLCTKARKRQKEASMSSRERTRRREGSPKSLRSRSRSPLSQPRSLRSRSVVEQTTSSPVYLLREKAHGRAGAGLESS